MNSAWRWLILVSIPVCDTNFFLEIVWNASFLCLRDVPWWHAIVYVFVVPISCGFFINWSLKTNPGLCLWYYICFKLIFQVKCHSIIFATGATARRLKLPREDEFWSRGISACAICDGASPLFKRQVLAVVGGGDTATEEALYLTKYARHVHLLVRKDQLRASKAMQDRWVLAHPYLRCSVAVVGNDFLAALSLLITVSYS